MYRAVIIPLLVFITQSGLAQFEASPRAIKFESVAPVNPAEQQLNKKSSSTYQACGQDTLEYARYKASAYVGVSIFKGYALGQLFEAPDTVTVSGFNFYAWGLMNNADSIAIYCHLYAASSDSLPTGNPLRSDTIYVDSTFNGGVLTGLKKFASWKPYETTEPYILVVRSEDSTRVAVVTNSYTNRDGIRENLASGSVGGTWYNALNLNIGGQPLDCDIILEPYVDYKIFNDFSFDDCYKTYDSVHFINKSSPILFSRMYNRYEFYNIGRYCHRWDYGNGFYQYGLTQDAFNIYTTSNNQTIHLISNIYQYRGSSTCRDTATKVLHFQPNPIKFTGIPSPVCTGDSLHIETGSNGIVRWFEHPFDTQAFYIGTFYNTPPLYMNDTSYVRAYNAGCTSIVARLELKVNDKPTITSTLNDSICINSLANLAAYSDLGTIQWFNDSTGGTSLHQGNVLQVGPLQADTSFFAHAINKGCISDGRVKVVALVSNDFAPSEPITSNDTSVCLLSDEFLLHASANETVRWFDVPSGGQPVHTGDSFMFSPEKKGQSLVFVDAFNGTCASSRLVIKVQVDHFETITDRYEETCYGNNLEADYSLLDGSIEWYDVDTTFVQDAKYITISEQGNHIFYVKPYTNLCADTSLHKIVLNIKPLPIIQVQNNNGACRGANGVVDLVDDGSDYNWYYNSEMVASGSSITTPPLYLNRSYQVIATKNGCESDTVIAVIVLKTPNANFDYQITWRNVDFVARDLTLASYDWDMDDNGKTYSVPQFKHYFAEDGDYKISLIGTGENGCRDTISKPVSINTLSVSDPERNYQILPNPSSGIFEVRLPLNARNVSIVVTDLSGKTINMVEIAGDSKIHFDLSDYAPGTYLVHLNLNGTVYHAKILKL